MEVPLKALPGTEAYNIDSRLFVYSGTSQEDIAVVHWWDRMHDDGELELVFMRSAQGLGGLFRMLGNCQVSCLFMDDDDFIWSAGWMEKFSTGIFFGLWVRKDRRKSKEAKEACAFIYDQATQIAPVVLGLTKQEKLLVPHQKIGYKIVGQLEKVWDGEDCWLVSLTREEFEAGCFGPRAMAEFRQRRAWVHASAAVGRVRAA
jgi:hypothetical protein